MILEDIELISFSDLTIEKKIMILEWRNHENVKKWMYSSESILEINHLRFIDKLKLDKNSLYFLVNENSINIGVIYFNNIDFAKKIADFGLYVNPFIKKIGVGSILGKISINYAFNILKLQTLQLEVFVQNERAINLYKKFNFKEFMKKTVNNQQIVCMELTNENR